jgi:DNA-binding transcriptional regulator GbsR (MarR family)
MMYRSFKGLVHKWKKDINNNNNTVNDVLEDLDDLKQHITEDEAEEHKKIVNDINNVIEKYNRKMEIQIKIYF